MLWYKIKFVKQEPQHKGQGDDPGPSPRLLSFIWGCVMCTYKKVDVITSDLYLAYFLPQEVYVSFTVHTG